MSQKSNKAAFTLAIGAAALAGSISTASANPFEMNQLSSGYQVGVQGDMGAKGPEGKCGDMDTDKDGKTSKAEFMAAHEAKFAKMDANSDGSLDAAEMKAGHEGKCGEGKCGGDKAKAAEGKCGGDKAKAAEGKCGEGKCGGDKAKATEGKCGEGKCGGDKK